MKHVPKIGAFVLETLTTGMYTNPFDSIREYIQNAADSIFEAERMQFLKKHQGVINVSLDPASRSLSIRDNGTGISATEVASRLLNVGMSNKVYGQAAGFRGIGRLAGIAYCKQLKFVTSHLYEDERSEIVFDCEGIRHSISPAMRQVEELTDVLRKYTSQDVHEDTKDSHFFEVQLIGIDPTVRQFLDLKSLEDYLCQVAPVEYDAQSFIFATKIQKWAAANGIELPYVKLLLRTPEVERQLFKPYKNTYKTKKGDYTIHVNDVEFLTSPDGSERTFWMWYTKTDLLGMFDDSRIAGLRFRRNNIAIGGPERVDELFPGNEGRLNYWMMGEIHITTDQVVPNARRDGFEATPAWKSLQEALLPFVRQHCKACHDASSATNRPTAKIVSSAQSTIQDVKTSLKTGLASKTERDDLLKKLSKEEERIQTALKTRTDNGERQKVQGLLTSIQALRTNIEENTSFTLDKVKSNLDRKQRRVLLDVLATIDQSLAAMSCSKSADCLQAIKRAIIDKFQTSQER